MNIRRSSGFTMIEIMLVVFIIGLLATLVGPRVTKLMFGGRESATKATLSSLKSALTEYNMDVGHFPKKLEGIITNIENSTKWNGPYLSGQTEVPTDAWGFEFYYNCPPQEFKKKFKYFELYSKGEHGDDAPEKEWLVVGE